MKTENHSVTTCDSVSTLAATVWKNKLLLLREKAPTMKTTMTWSALLIMTYVIGIYKAQGSTSSGDCRSPPYAVVGQPTWMQFRLSGDPKLLRKFMYISKTTKNTDASHAGAITGFVLEGTYSNQKKDMDIILPYDGYYYGGVSNNFLTLYISAVGPQHEGTYVAEDYKGNVSCHLKVLAAPPSKPALDTSTDAEKYSSAAAQAPDTSTDAMKDSCVPDVREKDCKDWIQMCWGLFGLVIVVLIVCGLPHVFWARWFMQKQSATGKNKTDEEGAHDMRKQSAAGKNKTDEEGAHDLRAGSQSKDKGRPGFSAGTDGAKDRADKCTVHLNLNEQNAGADSIEDQRDATPPSMPLIKTRHRTSRCLDDDDLS